MRARTVPFANVSCWANRAPESTVFDADVLIGKEGDKGCSEWKLQDEKRHLIEWEQVGSEKSRLRPQKHTTGVWGRCHRTGPVYCHCWHLRRLPCRKIRSRPLRQRRGKEELAQAEERFSAVVTREWLGRMEVLWWLGSQVDEGRRRIGYGFGLWSISIVSACEREE